jgi:hypothetical protein
MPGQRIPKRQEESKETSAGAAASDLAEGLHAAEEADDAEGAHEADDADGHVHGAEGDEGECDDDEVADGPAVVPEGVEPADRERVTKSQGRTGSRPSGSTASIWLLPNPQAGDPHQRMLLGMGRSIVSKQSHHFIR